MAFYITLCCYWNPQLSLCLHRARQLCYLMEKSIYPCTWRLDKTGWILPLLPKATEHLPHVPLSSTTVAVVGQGTAQRAPGNLCLADIAGWPLVWPQMCFLWLFWFCHPSRALSRAISSGKAFPPLHHQGSENTAGKLSPHHLLYHFLVKETICSELSEVKDLSRL